MFLPDYAQIMRRAHHVSKISAPSGIQATWQPKRAVFDFVQPRAGHHAADLRFLSKRHQVGHNIEVFAAPIAPGSAHAALDLVKNQQDIVFVTNLSERSQPFAAEMVVATLAL